MIWFAWREQRLRILVALGVVAVAAAGIVWLRLDAAGQWAQLRIPGCWQRPAGCSAPGMEEMYDRYREYLALRQFAGLGLPALLGMFVGAPMFAREAERGTHVFAVTQSVSRTRWWVTKALVGGLPVVVAMTGLGLLNGWASHPLTQFLGSRLTTPRFETEGLTLGGYTLLALTLGIAIGLWLRSTLATMALTLVLYLGVMVALTNGVRAHYLAPEVATASLSDRFGPQLGDDPWRLAQGYEDNAGNRIYTTPRECVGLGDREIRTSEDVIDCLRDLGYVRTFVTYHPGNRFWPLQGVESGIVVLLAGVALGLGAIALGRGRDLGGLT